MTVHPFIEAEKRDGHNVKRVCELLQVSRAAFYARRSARPGPQPLIRAQLRLLGAPCHEVGLPQRDRGPVLQSAAAGGRVAPQFPGDRRW